MISFYGYFLGRKQHFDNSIQTSKLLRQVSSILVDLTSNMTYNITVFLIKIIYCYFIYLISRKLDFFHIGIN